MSISKISIQIVTWNSFKYLPFVLKSIASLSNNDFSVLVIDNASRDDSVKYIRERYPTIKLLQNRHNLGFSKAHNQGISITKSPFILILNPDVILTPNYIKLLISEMIKESRIGSVTGRLLKYQFGKDEVNEIIYTKNIDTTGIEINRSRRVFNRGEGEVDTGQYDTKKDIFGVSGSASIYRREALDDCSVFGEYFDENFFAYKEDVDLAWRLQSRGWTSRYVPQALAYHHRQATGNTANDKMVIKQRRQHSKFINYYSYKNHLFTIWKNESIGNLIKDSPWIGLYELKKIVYIILFEVATIKSLFEYFKQLPKINNKRRYIQSKRREKASKIRKWFV